MSLSPVYCGQLEIEVTAVTVVDVVQMVPSVDVVLQLQRPLLVVDLGRAVAAQVGLFVSQQQEVILHQLRLLKHQTVTITVKGAYVHLKYFIVSVQI